MPYATIPRLIIIVPALLCLIGLGRVEWKEDLRELDYPIPELYDEAAQIQTSGGGPAIIYRYLVTGNSPSGALTALKAFEKAFPEVSSDWEHAGPFLPDYEAVAILAEKFRQHPDFPASLMDALEEEAFVADAFAPFTEAWTSWLGQGDSTAVLNQELHAFAESLPMPLDQALVVNEDGITCMLVQSPVGLDLQELPEGVVALDPVAKYNAILETYRQHLLVLVGVGCLVLMGGVVIMYRKAALAVLPVPFFAVAIVMGAGTLFFETYSLFHIVGGYLSLCISLDYALFAWESARRRKPLPGSVLLSMLTTAGVFGLLGTSGIPAVQALGLSVCSVVLVSGLLVLTAWRGRFRMLDG